MTKGTKVEIFEHPETGTAYRSEKKDTADPC